MCGSPVDPHSVSPSELKERLEADHDGRAYLVYFDADCHQVIRVLEGGPDRLSVGRSPGNDISLTWDPGVSRTHARLERIADDWVVVDGGLSRNGTFVNGKKADGLRRLEHDYVIQVGSTILAFQAPGAVRGASVPERSPTTEQPGGPPQLTPAQRRVLVALCRPYGESRRPFTATNHQIADELGINEDTVKNHHMRALFERFGVEGLSPAQKRLELMRRAFAVGAVTVDDYRR